MGTVYLVSTIILSTVFAALYKVANRRGCDLVNVNTVLYGSGTLLLAGFAAVYTRHPLPQFAVWMAAVSAVFGYVSTATFLFVMKQGRLSTGWTVISLAVIFPTVGSIVFFHEIPTLPQSVGIGLMLAALSSIAIDAKATKLPDEPRHISLRREHVYLFTSFVCTGIVSFANKVAAVYVARPLIPAYMAIYYAGATATAIACRAWRRDAYQPKDAEVGIMMGVTGALAILTFTLALTYIEGIVVFPVRACSNLILTAAAGVLVFREKPGVGGAIGAILGAASLVLINLK